MDSGPSETNVAPASMLTGELEFNLHIRKSRFPICYPAGVGLCLRGLFNLFRQTISIGKVFEPARAKDFIQRMKSTVCQSPPDLNIYNFIHSRKKYPNATIYALYFVRLFRYSEFKRKVVENILEKEIEKS